MLPGSFVATDLCSHGSMFPDSYAPRVLCSQDPDQKQGFQHITIVSLTEF